MQSGVAGIKYGLIDALISLGIVILLNNMSSRLHL
jgi:Flp pilus assembly pilin Flp